jgi:Flp pilus assembly protein TadG
MQLRHKRRVRRGTATVEFAMVAPVFLAMVLGVTETSRMFEVKNQLAVAAREGARTAAMERSGLVADGQSTNAKVTLDVKNYLKAAGLDPDKASVKIVSHSNPGSTFNLDDPANSLKYFELQISIPYSSTSSVVPPSLANFNLQSKIVFRNSKSQTAP